jgi:hypothetical protein
MAVTAGMQGLLAVQVHVWEAGLCRSPNLFITAVLGDSPLAARFLVYFPL